MISRSSRIVCSVGLSSHKASSGASSGSASPRIWSACSHRRMVGKLNSFFKPPASTVKAGFIQLPLKPPLVLGRYVHIAPPSEAQYEGHVRAGGVRGVPVGDRTAVGKAIVPTDDFHPAVAAQVSRL